MHIKGVAAFNPFASACRAIEVTLVRSSYDEFVHEPIKEADMLSFQPFSLTIFANLLSGVARSGVWGPFLQ